MDYDLSPKSIIHVLLADDHVVVRAGYASFWSKARIFRWSQKLPMVRRLASCSKQFKPDVAVLDIQMPLMSGIEVTR